MLSSAISTFIPLLSSRYYQDYLCLLKLFFAFFGSNARIVFLDALIDKENTFPVSL